MFQKDPVDAAARELILAFREERGEGLRNLRLLTHQESFDILLRAGKLIESQNVKCQKDREFLYQQAREEFKAYGAKTVNQAIDKCWRNLRADPEYRLAATGKGIENNVNFARIMEYAKAIDETTKRHETNNSILHDINTELGRYKVNQAEPQQPSRCILV